MATVVRENIGLLHDKLTVKVSKDDYFPAFDKKLKEYSKTVILSLGLLKPKKIKSLWSGLCFMIETEKLGQTQVKAFRNTDSSKFAEF